MLWLALNLPQLALDLAQQVEQQTTPLVVVHRAARRQQVLQANPCARALGIESGLPLASALALIHDSGPQLQIVPYRADTESLALQRLAQWAQQFSPQICIHDPASSGRTSPSRPISSNAALILEIGASLRLFGGLNLLCEQISHGLHTLAFHHSIGIAPTATAAWLLALNNAQHDARHGANNPAPQTTAVLQNQSLKAALADLPLHNLPLATSLLEDLHGLGLRNLGDCLQLPVAETEQRLGRQLALLIEQALGKRPRPWPDFKPPTRFHGFLPLPAAVTQHQPLIFALQDLLRELCGFLRARDEAVSATHLKLHHPQGTHSDLHLSLLQPTRDSEHLLLLWRERLEQTTLTQPVEALELYSLEQQKQVQRSVDLWGNSNDDSADDFSRVLERIRNRLGPQAIAQLHAVADYRPERASSLHSLSEPAKHTDTHPREKTGRPTDKHIITPSPIAAGSRPCWLLPIARPLSTDARGRPCLHAPLHILSGPERIESGWWDDNDLCRDYYIASNPQRQRLWIYKLADTQNGQHTQWFLHGLFS